MGFIVYGKRVAIVVGRMCFMKRGMRCGCVRGTAGTVNIDARRVRRWTHDVSLLGLLEASVCAEVVVCVVAEVLWCADGR